MSSQDLARGARPQLRTVWRGSGLAATLAGLPGRSKDVRYVVSGGLRAGPVCGGSGGRASAVSRATAMPNCPARTSSSGVLDSQTARGANRSRRSDIPATGAH